MSILSQLGVRRKTKQDDRMLSSKSVHSQKLDTEEDNLFKDDESNREDMSPTLLQGPQYSQQKMQAAAQKELETIDERGADSEIRHSRLQSLYNRQSRSNSHGSNIEYPIYLIENSPSSLLKRKQSEEILQTFPNDEIKLDQDEVKIITEEEQDNEVKERSSSNSRPKNNSQHLKKSRSIKQANQAINHPIEVDNDQIKVHKDFLKFSNQVKKTDGKKKYKKIIDHECINLEGYTFKDYVLKEFLRQKRLTLKTISIKECRISNKSRIEALYMLFLQDDLTVGDFPVLKEISIDLVETENDMNRNQSKNSKTRLQNIMLQTNTKKILRQRIMYQKTIDEIQKEFQVVKKMEYCIQCDGQVMVINQLAFQDKKAFYYIKKHLAQKVESLRCLVFINIANLRKNSLKSIFESLRECITLQEINFINTIINRDSLILIRNILTWFSADLRSIKFIENELNENDLQLLFLDKNHLIISDLYNLEELIISKNPQACNSSSYFDIMKIFKRQIEIASEFREKAICLPLFSAGTYLQSRPHFKLFPFNLQPRKYSLQFNDDVISS